MRKYFFIMLIIMIGYITLKEKVYDEKTIVIGTSLPKTGVMKELGQSVFIGANAYFSYANDNNILKSKKIKFIAYDDKYEPELTLINAKKLIDDNSFLFFSFVGTPTVKKILPIIEDNNIPFIAPITGASFLRNERYKNIVNFRSSYYEEIKSIVKYLIVKKNIKKFAIFYQNDDYGESGYISIINALKEYNLSLVANGSYKRNTLSIRQAFNEINEAKPEAILMVGAYKANALFIKMAKKSENLKNNIFTNLSFGHANEMIKELDFKVNNILFSQVVPYYLSNKIEIINEYKSIMSKYYPSKEYDFISLESFLSAKLVVDTLKKIQGNITRSKFLNQIKNLPHDSLKDLKIEYKHMELHNKIYLFKYLDNQFIEVNYED